MDYCQELFCSLAKTQACILEICALGEEIPMIMFLKKELYLEMLGDTFGCCDYDKCNFLVESISTFKKSLRKQCKECDTTGFAKEYRNLRKLIKENTILELQDELDDLEIFLDSLPIDEIIDSLEK